MTPEESAPASVPGDLVADYTARAAAHRRAIDAASRSDRRIGVVRLLLFVAGALTVIAIVESRIGVGLGTSIVVLLGAVFSALVAWQAAVRERWRMFRALERCCETGVSRVLRRWDAIPPAVELRHAPDHAFAGDLHVAGPHSLARLLPRMSSVAGRVAAEWLLAEVPPSADVLQARQTAVRELAPHTDWRERLSVLASRLVAGERSLETFLAWAETEKRTEITRSLRWSSVALAALTVLSLVGSLAQVVSPSVPVALIFVNLAVTAATRRRVTRAMDVIAGHETRLRGLGDVLHHASAAPGETPELSRLRQRWGNEESARAFRWFDQLAKLAEARLSPMGHVVLQALTLWDLHVAAALERWRARHGASVRAWLRALGEVETLAALATLAYDNPAWVFPEFGDETSPALEADGLAHPLLAPGVPVANDVRVGGPGEILFITGSNMSGKSTLLRAIGLNVVLAQAGAPVCAKRMRLARARLRTSIEATDALERGLSLFMAELLRIKAIVDAARSPSDCRLLYITDEMLRGTNARDRHAAVATILGHLVRAGAAGVVATHDPDLASDQRLRPHLQSYHFIEHFRIEGDAPSMWFDYRLRPGLATTSNAIALLELVGLGERVS